MSASLKEIVEVVGQRIGKESVIGAEIAHAFNLIKAGDKEAVALYDRFLMLEATVVWTKSRHHLPEFDRTADQFEKWVKRKYKGPQRKSLLGEIEERRKMINFHLGEIELSTAKASKAASLLNSESTQIFHSLLIDRILELRLNAGPTEQGALLAFQALQTVLGHSPQSWNRVLNYCVRNAKRIAEDARQLRDLMKDLRKLEPGSKDYEKALRQLRKAPSRFVWPIRGNLGELFLSHWPQWRRELSKLLQEAENIAEREMGSPGWEAVPFSGNVRLGGKMTWDEGILLINRTKKPPRFALHTAAQVKIQRRVKGVDQIIADRSAEIGKSAKVPELELLTNGTSEVFVYEKLPEHVSTHRYLFYPEEGKITAADIEKLKANKMQAQAVAMDISADDLEALAHQFMYAVEDLISRSL